MRKKDAKQARQVQVHTDLKVKVLPRSSRNQIVGRDEDVFRIKVTSPPIHGLANLALVGLLAKRLRVPKGQVEIISGRGSRLKSVRIHGLSPGDVAALLDMSEVPPEIKP
jgi:uncharacterized protein (TIGR00251 family)